MLDRIKGTVSALEITTVVPPKLASACYNGDISATTSSDTEGVHSLCVQLEENQVFAKPVSLYEPCSLSKIE
ncbi:hypothetical protein L5515_017272 [Caenorhabditis briggsae]|uniref:Uncharacterized protein n=1 Tax=Caenorhabditis briggsae TaxID=6238 RepID=A0AAE9JSE8_CAEBR|nr:hypothetical protein L5515_017272 [Caenorhabditis briggsae]